MIQAGGWSWESGVAVESSEWVMGYLVVGWTELMRMAVEAVVLKAE